MNKPIASALLSLVLLGTSLGIQADTARPQAAAAEATKAQPLGLRSLGAFRERLRNLHSGAAERTAQAAAAATFTPPFPGADAMAYVHPETGGLGVYDSAWLQVLDRPVTGYNPAKDLGPQNNDDLDFLAQTRPAVVTNTTGTYYFWVSLGGRLFAEVDPYDSNAPENVEITGDGEAVRTIAVSPDGRWLAFTAPNLYDKNLYLYDFNANLLRVLPIARANAALNDVLFAGELSFDRTGNKLMFELKRCEDPGQANCDAFLENANYWSICELDLAAMTFRYPFPARHVLLNLRVPNYAKQNSDEVLVSAVEFVNSDFESSVRLLNLRTGTFRKLFGFPRGILHYAFADFWGRDDLITYMEFIDNVTFYAKRVPINAARNVDLGASRFINDYPVRAPRMVQLGSAVNTLPVARNDQPVTTRGTAKVLTPMANDTDADGDVLRLISTTTPDHGGHVQIVNNSRQIRYTPAAGFTGRETFRYTIGDGRGGRATAQVFVIVKAP